MALEYPRDVLNRLVSTQKLNLSALQLDWLSRLMDAVFFASLSIEEGEHVRLAVVHDEEGSDGLARVVDSSPGTVGNQEPAWDVTRMPRRDFDAPTLAKLARGIEYGAQLVVVGGAGGELWIDGIARMRRRTDGGSALRIAAPRPGVLVLERRMKQILRYEAGRQALPHIDVFGSRGPVREALRSILGESADGAPEDAANVDGQTLHAHSEVALLQLIRKMRATESGAILALLGHEPEEAVRRSVRYGRSDPMILSSRIKADKELGLAAIFRRAATHDEDLDRDQVRARDAAQDAADVASDELEAALDDVAQLSAIDGAVLGGPSLAIYGAGYMIPSRPLEPGTVRRAVDAQGARWEEYPARHGARHMAGVSFAYENPGAVAFVVSEDGPVSCALRVGEHIYVWPVEILET